MRVYRCFTEKREGFDVEARSLLRDVRDFLGINGVDSVRVLCRYDVEGVTDDAWLSARETVFSEPQVDYVYDEAYPLYNSQSLQGDAASANAAARTLTVEALPGQYDQRADSCAQCIELLSQAGRPLVRTAKVYIFNGDVSDTDMDRLRSYLINPVESREAESSKPETLAAAYAKPPGVEILHGFTSAPTGGSGSLADYAERFNLAMDMSDLCFIQSHFREVENRDPTAAELRILDTYWSDHCRHTTFNTHLSIDSIDDPAVSAAYDAYLAVRREAYGGSADERAVTLMDIATLAAKALRARGLMQNIDVSDEVNACSVHVEAMVNGVAEDWLLMFKNETHNHPTEIEPFGGAATCIGGAIRDPLSGRAFVYQAMRVTGSGDPRASISDTVPGKLPQRRISLGAAQGYSSYGNQIGLASGLIHEIYHPGYIAKRMELGAVTGAVRASGVLRLAPEPGDKVILLGGRTGRDGIGGATGSSKMHTSQSVVTMASEVQKGNAPEERKIQRLFLDPEVAAMIKRCNDFGAGGVCVAVGELADGLDIDLSLVRLKYDGLDGTEIAISESQERMAVVVAPGNVSGFIEKAAGENLEAYVIAEVTDSERMIMRYDGEVIADLSRSFLSSNGAAKASSVRVPVQGITSNPVPVQGATSNPVPVQGITSDPIPVQGTTSDPIPVQGVSPALVPAPDAASDGASARGAASPGLSPDSVSSRFTALVRDLRFCSQRGLYEMFDGTVGASSVLMKNGGKTQTTPVQVMASLLPAGFYDLKSETSTCSVMSYGFDPYLSSENPFAGARAAVVTSVAKLVAAGCDPDKVYLTFQEYYEKLRNDPLRWGKPFAALLGAFEAQMGLELAAIGGKDSMSGSFNDMDVPPTLVSFAVAPNDASRVISPEFKEAVHDVVLIESTDDLPVLKNIWRRLHKLITDKIVVSAWAVTEGGSAEAVFKMALGNSIGFEAAPGLDPEHLFACSPGAIVAEISDSAAFAAMASDIVSGITPEPVQAAVSKSAQVSASGTSATAASTPSQRTGAALSALPIGRTIEEPLIIAGNETIGLLSLRDEWERILINVYPTASGDEGTVRQLSYDHRPVEPASERFGKPRALILAFPGTNSEIDAARAIYRAGAAPRIIVIKNLTPQVLESSLNEVAEAIRKSQIIILPGGFSFGDEPDGSAKFISVFFRNPLISDAIHEHLKHRDGLMLGICNGFQALIKLGLVPFGEIVPPNSGNPTLTHNLIGRHQAGYTHTRIASVNSPWMSKCSVGDIHTIAISHGEGRFIASDEILAGLAARGQIATQYTGADGIPGMSTSVNPNGSDMAVEGLFSPDGRVFGKMGHTERAGQYVARNIYGNKRQLIFEGGVDYYR